jgi:hypothetical protein
MGKDLVPRLRAWAVIRSDVEVSKTLEEAANCIEELRSALADIIWVCPHEGPDDWCGKEYCPCKDANDALEKQYE